MIVKRTILSKINLDISTLHVRIHELKACQNLVDDVLISDKLLAQINVKLTR